MTSKSFHGSCPGCGAEPNMRGLALRSTVSIHSQTQFFTAMFRYGHRQPKTFQCNFGYSNAYHRGWLCSRLDQTDALGDLILDVFIN